MKNIFLLFAILGIISILSCAKESKCECTTYKSDTIVTVTDIKGKFEEDVCLDSSYEEDQDTIYVKKVCLVK